MAHLKVKTPNGATYSIDLDAMCTPSGSTPSNWAYLPNDCIIQWGLTDTATNAITFPISFTADSDVYYVVTQGLSDYYGADAPYYLDKLASVSKTGFNMHGVGSRLYWMSIGKKS